ncbi:MAG: hypothetical protein NUW01_16860 [Gemmatimonadaceae bacterium]|nr:hypothetical protein [Gemmatimonadaceae bacterium]
MQLTSYHVVALAALSALLTASVAETVGAQVAYDAPHARVEVLGLQRWTLKALQDSIGQRVPGQTLADAACMVTLRDSLHFADALVNDLTYSMSGEPTRHYLIIKVIEPQDSARVRWRSAPRDTFKVLRPNYAAVVIPVTDAVGTLWMGRLLGPLQSYNSDPALRLAAIRSRPKAAQADADRLWSFLDTHRAEADRRTALAALRRDGPYANRVIAAAVLANFAEQDSTWWGLAEALRDGNEAVRTAALLVLRGLPTRTVNWEPVTPTLRALLGGTNVGATQDVLELLEHTQVSAALARPLLRDNGSWVLTHLRAEYPRASLAAHALLLRLNGGHDLGTSDIAWASWLATL